MYGIGLGRGGYNFQNRSHFLESLGLGGRLSVEQGLGVQASQEVPLRSL